MDARQEIMALYETMYRAMIAKDRATLERVQAECRMELAPVMPRRSLS